MVKQCLFEAREKYGTKGGLSGDLYVTIYVKKDNVFSRKGDNILCTIPITYSQAVLGAEIDVPTPDSKGIKYKIPEGTRNGNIIYSKRKGI